MFRDSFGKCEPSIGPHTVTAFVPITCRAAVHLVYSIKADQNLSRKRIMLIARANYMRGNQAPPGNWYSVIIHLFLHDITEIYLLSYIHRPCSAILYIAPFIEVRGPLMSAGLSINKTQNSWSGVLFFPCSNDTSTNS